MIEPSSGHREALESKLLADYDLRYSKLPGNSGAREQRARWAALGAAAVLLLGIFAASRAPADYVLELGQRIEIDAPSADALPDGRELSQWIEAGLAREQPGQRELQVRMMRSAQGASICIDLWGAPIAGVLEALRQHLPALTAEQLHVKLLRGRVRTNLAGLVEHRLLHRDAAAREQLRQQLMRQLSKEGEPDAEVQIDETAEGRERVTIKVER